MIEWQSMQFKSMVFLLVSSLLIGLGVIGVLIFNYYQTPVDSQNIETISFVIPRGQATTITGQRLYEAGLIKHPYLFKLAVQIEQLSGKIQAGSFELSQSMTVSEIARSLTQGTQDIWITIVEGWRMEQIAESLAGLDLPLFDPDEFKKIVQETQTEGRLFPDTYLIPKQYTAAQIHVLLTTTFERRVLQDLASEIEKNEQSIDAILIMASLVEREAREYEEMRGVAGVLWHRISIGMPLQVDATMQYAKGYNQIQQTWWAPPLAVDKSIDSPFNTYQIAGLPPAPIANPSLNAIKATLNPIQTKNLFYIHDRSGKIHYAENLEGHNANINRYLR